MLPSSPDLEEVARSICASRSFAYASYLGGGSFKQAFLVTLPDGSSHGALKVIRDPRPSRRTAREIEALRRCDHPNIAKLLAVGEHEHKGKRFQFLLEEYLEGGPLSERLQTRGTLGDQEALSLGSSLIEALSYLHGLNMVHRDIKPDNILFREDQRTPVLVDFGIVRDLTASSLTDTWAPRGPGTPYFASPEQLNNQKHLIDWRSDQFSLGVTISFARFGVHPYQHPGEPAFAPETVERTASRGSRHPDFSHTVAAFCRESLLKMTEPWPVSRYRTPSNLQSAWGR